MREQGGRKLWLASPRGFCAGVARAVEMAENALDADSRPLYALRDIVHNPGVVERLRVKGMRVVSSPAAVPEGARVLFSAHGVSPAERELTAERKLEVLDSTCPFVERVHAKVRRYAGDDYSIAYIGHRGHVEVAGVRGEAPEHITVLESAEEAERYRPRNPRKVAVAIQTTWAREDADRVLEVLRRRFPELTLSAADDICKATTERQRAVRELAGRVGFVLVLGGENSSNTRRLLEVARREGAEAFLVSEAGDLENIRLPADGDLGLTAGASTPGSFVEEIVGLLKKRGFSDLRELHPRQLVEPRSGMLSGREAPVL